MKIVIASGKGGTGKTLVAINLALSVGANQVLDCDVEEPNAHLFLDPEINSISTVNTAIPLIDETKCTYCRKCVEICRFNALTIVGETILTFSAMCHSCGGCMLVCPENAITESKREIGIIEHGQRGPLDFVHGRLRIGEAMSPPLIKQVRSFSNPAMTSIIDAPPGTSCPVIAAMKGVDFVLMVTEPTPFGLHDLRLAVEAVRTLGIPHGLVINRSDVGDDCVREYAAQQNLPILMEIPFKRSIAEAYSNGKLLVEVMPEWRDKFKMLFHKIENSLERGDDLS